MVQISGENARFLRTPAILSEVIRTAEPNLKFLGLIPHVDTKGEPISIGVKSSASSDAKKQTPRMTTASAKFPELDITAMTKDTAITTAQGVSLKFDEDAMNTAGGRDIIMDKLETAGFWVAEAINSQIYSALDDGSTDDGLTFDNEWSSADATPLIDLLNFKNSMVTSGKPFRMTDIYVDETNYSELEGFLIGSEIPQYRDAALTTNLQDEIVLPIEGAPVVHRVIDGVTHGDIMGIDRRSKSFAALYYNNSKQFGTPKTIVYETIEAGKTVRKAVPNFGVCTHQFVDDDTHDTVVQIWLDNVVKVKDAYGIRTGDGI